MVALRDFQAYACMTGCESTASYIWPIVFFNTCTVVLDGFVTCPFAFSMKQGDYMSFFPFFSPIGMNVTSITFHSYYVHIVKTFCFLIFRPVYREGCQTFSRW